MAATGGALSEREREVRFRLVLVGRATGKGDSELPLYIEDSGGGVLTSLEALVDPFDIRIKLPSGSKS